LFPGTTITGTDLSPVQPTEVPENVHFLIDDAAEEDWLWPLDSFDFIHMSNMVGSFDFPRDIIRKAMKYTKTGGYFEWHEVDPQVRCDDNTMPPPNPDGFSGYPFGDWVDLCERASLARDPPRPFRIAHKLAQWMRDVGFVDVRESISKIPLNAWPRDPALKSIGSWAETVWSEGLAAYSYKPFLSLGWTKEEIEVFLVSVRESMRNRRIRAYFNLYVVTGRKPQRGASAS
jgi:hypothetical protein